MKILTDSGVYVEGDGYEFVALVSEWHPDDSDIIAQAHIRIDRVPHLSFATVSVWLPTTGWQQMIRLHPDVFWMRMPGSDRAGQERTAQKCQKLVGDLIAELTRVAEHI